MRKSSFCAMPGPSRSLRVQLQKRANADYNSKQLWRDLNMPVACQDLFKPNIFSLPDRLLRHSAKMKPLKGPHQKKSKKGVKSKFLFIKFYLCSIQCSYLYNLINTLCIPENGEILRS